MPVWLSENGPTAGWSACPPRFGDPNGRPCFFMSRDQGREGRLLSSPHPPSEGVEAQREPSAQGHPRILFNLFIYSCVYLTSIPPIWSPFLSTLTIAPQCPFQATNKLHTLYPNYLACFSCPGLSIPVIAVGLLQKWILSVGFLLDPYLIYSVSVLFEFSGLKLDSISPTATGQCC